MKITLLIVSFTLFLQGCASNHLGSYAEFDPATGSVSPLQISARFDGRACSDYFSYIDISIHNPSSRWQKVKDVKIKFPGLDDEGISVVQGGRLLGWAESEGRRRSNSDYNSSLASLAVSVVGIGLMASNSKSTRNAGATLVLGSGINSETKKISKNINTLETSRATANNYFVNNDIEIAPGMSRKFWLVLNASDDAPLMGSLQASFNDNADVQQVFIAPLANWQTCSWQGKRKEYLKTVSKVRVGKGVVSGSPASSRRVRSAFDQSHLLGVELKLRAQTHDQEDKGI